MKKYKRMPKQLGRKQSKATVTMVQEYFGKVLTYKEKYMNQKAT